MRSDTESQRCRNTTPTSLRATVELLHDFDEKTTSTEELLTNHDSGDEVLLDTGVVLDHLANRCAREMCRRPCGGWPC